MPDVRARPKVYRSGWFGDEAPTRNWKFYFKTKRTEPIVDLLQNKS